MTRKLRAIALSIGGIALLMLIVAFMAVQIQQRLLRHRAERLFEDVKKLQLHPGSFKDLQELQTRWGAWGRYEGTCTADHCAYTIELNDELTQASLTHHTTPFRVVERTYQFLGGRWAGASAQLNLQSNHLWNATYRLLVGITPQDRGAHDFGDYPYPLIAVVTSSPRMFFIKSASLRRGYDIGRAEMCTVCVMGWINFTAQTDEKDIQRLARLNFTCITRRAGCTTQPDIMPIAWSQYMEDDKARSSVTTDVFDCDAPLSDFAREAENIIIAKAVGDPHHAHDSPLPQDNMIRLKVLQQIKNAAPQRLGTLWRTYSNEQDPNIAKTSPPTSTIAVGGTYILMFEQPDKGYGHPDILEFNPCAVYPATPTNVAEAVNGAALDTSIGDPDAQR